MDLTKDAASSKSAIAMCFWGKRRPPPSPAVQAGCNAYLAEQRHADWAEHNIAVRDMPGYVQSLRSRIEQTLLPYAAEIEKGGPQVNALCRQAVENSRKVQAVLDQMPIESKITELADLSHKALNAVAAVRGGVCPGRA